jgi:WD40 repeat protein
VAFSGVNRLVVGAADLDVTIWNTETHSPGATWRSMHSGAINALATHVEADGQTSVATGGEDGVIAVSTLADSEPRIFYPDRRQVPIDTLAFTPDGKTLASGSDDGTIQLWDIRTRLPIIRLPGTGSQPVTSLSINRAGTLLAAVSADGVIHLWDLPRRTAVATLTGPVGTTAVAFRPDGDGRTFATADQDGTPVLWDTDPVRVNARLCAGALTAVQRRSVCT